MSHPLTRRRPLRFAAVLPVLVLVLAACGSGGTNSQPPGSQAPASQAGGSSVTMSGLAFKVAEITVPVGNLTFVNQDGVTHVIAEGENGVEAASPRVEKVSVNGGSEGDLVFTAAGDYHITCLVHPTMNMEVHVQ
jgi:plastocyanin